MLFSSEWLYLIVLLLSSLSKTSAMCNSIVTTENLASTTSPISLSVSFASDFQRDNKLTVDVTRFAKINASL